MSEEKNGSTLVRLVRWFDTRLGLSYPLLRSVPQYAINPLYWLGALTIAAFIIQGVTGMIMMLYYVPSPNLAYSTTQYVFQNVYYGQFLQTVHLYTAYAMIMLAFMHMMRGYFVSVHKKPREVMWVIGMMMGFVTLGFGFTGYLLPWSVVSKSATDVGVGMIDALPQPLSSFLSFLAVGVGGDATELLRFYDLHVVVLPAVLLVLLTVKVYMLETHGIGEPVTGDVLSERQKRTFPIFPDVTVYLLELAAIFGSGMLLISVLFPLKLPPQYTPQLAAQTAAQPDWYFLWIYQILKISVFEGLGLTVALSFVTVVFVLLIVLPFIDRGATRQISKRLTFITIGAVFVAELVVLAVWGYVTPGQVISVEQAILVLGGIALLVALTIAGVFRIGSWSASKGVVLRPDKPHFNHLRASASLVILAAIGAFAIGRSLDAAVKLALGGFNYSTLAYLVASLVALGVVSFATILTVYRIELRADSLRRRIQFFESKGRTN